MKRRIMAGDIPEWILKHSRKQYIMQAILATCAWVSKEELKEIDAKAKWMTKVTGVPHVVDHIIALNRKDICGLTVPLNLRVITKKQNAYESNHWSERITDMFAEPEQLSLLERF